MYAMQQQHASGAGTMMPMAGQGIGGGPGPGAGTGICVSLVQSALWSQFHNAQTEMIVTKTGRKLFPKLEISIQGLTPGRMYGVHMRLERADEKKYRYTCSKWSASNDDDDACFPLPPPIESNEGFAQLGDFWTARAIEFSNFKITNNQEESGRGMILVQTLHKYVPVIYIYEMVPGASYSNLEPAFVHKEVLPLAEFITVTAYQNEAIKTLKTAHNPFAKGCRGAAAKPALQHSPTDSLLQQRPLKRSYSPASTSGLMGHRSSDGAPCSKLASPAFPRMDLMQPSPSYTVPPTVSQPPPSLPYPTPPPESPSAVPDHQVQHHHFDYQQMGFFDPRYMMMQPFYPFFPGMGFAPPQQPQMEYLQQMQQPQQPQQQQQQYLPAPYTPHNQSEPDSSSSNGNSPANSHAS